MQLSTLRTVLHISQNDKCWNLCYPIFSKCCIFLYKDTTEMGTSEISCQSQKSGYFFKCVSLFCHLGWIIASSVKKNTKHPQRVPTSCQWLPLRLTNTCRWLIQNPFGLNEPTWAHLGPIRAHIDTYGPIWARPGPTMYAKPLWKLKYSGEKGELY